MLIPATRPDVAVLDVRLPDGNGIELCRDLLSELPELSCLMLTSFTSDQAMLDAILAGASGYVLKDIRGMQLAQAIKDVGAGRSPVPQRGDGQDLRVAAADQTGDGTPHPGSGVHLQARSTQPRRPRIGVRRSNGITVCR